MPISSDQPLQLTETGDLATVDDQFPSGTEQIVPLYVEDVAISRRTVAKSVVRVATVTHRRDHLVDETLSRERVEIERVPIGHYVDSIPPVREEGDVTIMSVVEEVVVVERKLLLREEVHIRRVQFKEQHVETVQLREQDVVITRTPTSDLHALVPSTLSTNLSLEHEK